MKIRRFVTVSLLSILFTIGLFLSDSSSTHAYETRVTGLEVKSTNNDALQPSNGSSIVPIGYNFPIALNKGNEIQGKPGIAFDGSNFFAVWANLSNNNIYGARVSQAGVVLDPNAISISVSLNSLVRQPSVAFDGTNFFEIGR